MTVKELIEKLSNLPQELGVHIGVGHEFGDTNQVSIKYANGIHEEYVFIED